MVAEKRLGLRDQGGEVVEMQGLLAQEVTESLASARPKAGTPDGGDLLLVRRDGGLALRIGLNHRGGQGEFTGDKRQHIREQFERLLARKAAGEPQKGHLIRQAQAVMLLDRGRSGHGQRV